MRAFVMRNRPDRDWCAKDIEYALNCNGWDWASLARATGYRSSSALRSAIYKPYPKAERIIANACHLPPESIWPERYKKRNFTPVLSPSTPVCAPRVSRQAALAID